MQRDDAQLGRPFKHFRGTKAEIEALTGLVGGEEAHATDSGDNGVYDEVLSRWVWFKLTSGTWTPTGTAGTNVAAMTTYIMNYIRIGDQVFFNGLVSIDTTATGAFTCYLSLPIASNFNASTDASGNGTQPGQGGGNNIISIREDQTNDRLQLDGYTYSNTEVFYRLAGGYIIK